MALIAIDFSGGGAVQRDDAAWDAFRNALLNQGHFPFRAVICL
ncbi:hypothetical protein [Burkholderia ambifaria]|nr:hypothetical protein [Burkholderia ambifaria]WDR89771.1 hypothetical protein OR986_12670 [Burkholderia ambifaria]WDS02586.1 hypothetical protein OR985_17635 [Burkholderia ambifaria]